jgi:hypothetical protein
LRRLAGGGDELPFGSHGGEASFGESAQAEDGLAVPESGFDRPGALLVETATRRGVCNSTNAGPPLTTIMVLL